MKFSKDSSEGRVAMLLEMMANKRADRGNLRELAVALNDAYAEGGRFTFGGLDVAPGGPPAMTWQNGSLSVRVVGKNGKPRESWVKVGSEVPTIEWLPGEHPSASFCYEMRDFTVFNPTQIERN